VDESDFLRYERVRASLMYVIGIWDGHDSGAALLEDSRVVFAVNEERLSRRKLEIRFPQSAIEACLEFAGIGPDRVGRIGLATGDLAKCISRLFPQTKERYYLLRRRKRMPSPLNIPGKLIKYPLTEIGASAPTKRLSEILVRSKLTRMGFRDFSLEVFDHHLCHAVAAAVYSGYDTCAVVTLDGVGDGASGTVGQFTDGTLRILNRIPARDSLGIFFEHVTNLLNMRELEDEGKVMALAGFAYPVPDEQNPMLSLFTVDGVGIRAKHGGLKMYHTLKRILWGVPSEQFAYMAQRVLELRAIEIVRNALKATKSRKLAFAGGVAANILLNMQIRDLPEVDDLFVFPHMGDGGLALGAAVLAACGTQNLRTSYPPNLFWGHGIDPHELAKMAAAGGYKVTMQRSIEGVAARLIADGKVVLWADGRMEYGPRALGARSILARPDSLEVKDKLNLQLKKRVWYQPFCPSVLEDEMPNLFANANGRPDRFMTTAYRAREDLRDRLQGVIHLDGTCRPQAVDPSTRLGRVLTEFRRAPGLGAVLNTSMNVHGEPIACSAEDVLRTFRCMEAPFLVCGDFLVEGSAR